MKEQIANKISETLNKIESDYKAELAPTLEVIAALVHRAIEENFARRGRWDGSGTDIFSGGNQRWRPLAPTTIEKYMKLGYELNPTLDRGGLLRRSIATYADKKNIAVVISVANVPYAAVHQFGYGRIPARPYITLTEQDLEIILDLLMGILKK